MGFEEKYVTGLEKGLINIFKKLVKMVVDSVVVLKQQDIP